MAQALPPIQNTPTTIAGTNVVVPAGVQYGPYVTYTPMNPSGTSVLTSTPAATQTKSNVNYVNDTVKQAAAAKAAADAKRAADQADYDRRTAEIAAQRGQGAAADVLAGFIASGPVSSKGEYSAVDKARIAEIQRISSQLETLSTQMDSRTAAQIDTIKQEYDALAKKQEVANAEYEGGVSTAGLASGRNRYAPEIQAGIQSAAVASGISALSNIQMKKQQLIMEAEQARDERKYKVLQSRVQELKTLQKEEREAAQQMVENYYKEQDFLRKNTEFLGQNLAPAIASSLTGDPSTDNRLIIETAKANGISANSLLRYVDDYKSQQSKLYDTADIKEFNYALSRGDIPASSNFNTWRNTKAINDSGASTKGASAWNLYGDDLMREVSNGASLPQAIQIVAAVANNTGTKLDLTTQYELLKILKERSSPVGMDSTIKEATLPGEFNIPVGVRYGPGITYTPM